MKSLPFFLVATLLFTGVLPAFAAETVANAESSSDIKLPRDERMAWWREAKFGMFVHWGVYATVGGEYKGQKLPNSAEWMMCRGKIPIAEYEEYAAQFNPTEFDATKFVERAKNAGMKYLVITAKHHDGFGMFASKSTDFNVVDATPFKRDIMKELADACAEQGLKFGFYYSQAQDWHHPGGFGNNWDKSIKRVSSDDYVFGKAVPEVQQLLTDYGPIGIFWWDTPRNMSEKAFHALHSLTSLQPNCITNDRLGKGYKGDYETFERNIPKKAPVAEDWEVCMPISGSWGYKKGDNSFKSIETLIRNLADIASKGGNYLLNVSPTGTGGLLPPAVERLEAIGAWMKINGDSIYGTTASPLGKLAWGRCTKKVAGDSAKLYLHVFDWPADGRLQVPGLKSSVSSAYLLDGNVSVATSADDTSVYVSLPAKAPDARNSVVVLEIDGPLEVEAVDSTTLAGGLVLLAEDAYLNNNEGSRDIRVAESGGVPHLGYWTDPQASVQWTVRASETGTYEVFAEIALEASSTELVVTTPGNSVATQVESTGGYGSFATVSLGKIELKAAEAITLELKPEAASWNPVNLRKIELRPTKD